MFAENVRDDIRDIVQLHNLAIYDRVRLKILIAKAHELKAAILALQLYSLNGTGAYVEAHHILFADATCKHNLAVPCHSEAYAMLPAQASADSASTRCSSPV
jgi:hypothetical protein